MVGERPPPTEADREGMRAYVDILKHLGTLSGAAVVAIGALYKALELGSAGTVASEILFGVAFVVSLVGAVMLTFRLGASESPSSKTEKVGYWTTWLSLILISGGVLSFMINSFYSWVVQQ